MNAFETGPEEALSGGRQDAANRTPTRSRRRRRRFGRRSVEMLPTVVTLGNLFCGFLAIAYIADSLHAIDTARRVDLQVSAVFFIFLAMMFDAIDGKVARMTGLTTRFGAELDSICDVVSFGAAPAFLFKVLAESGPDGLRPKAALIIAVIYLACSALRLARFNVETDADEESHHFFQGLPTPAAAAVLISLVWLNATLDPGSGNSWVRTALRGVLPLLGFLMVSRIRYVHVASWIFRRKSKPMFTLILFGAALVVLFHDVLIPALCVGFMLSGPAWWAWRRWRQSEAAEPLV